jgi:hypothetical protein
LIKPRLSVFGETLPALKSVATICPDIAKDKALRLVTNQQVPTPQAIGTWLNR